MNDLSKVIITLILSAVVVAVIYFSKFQLNGQALILINYGLGGLAALNAVAGVFRGEIFTRRFGLVKKEEDPALFNFNVVLYFVIGIAICALTGLVNYLHHSGSVHIKLTL